jgi:hypothetical protein
MTQGPRLRFASPEEIAHLTRGKRLSANQWVGHCPCHDDQNPSLSIRRGRKMGTVIKCHGGCGQKELLAWFRRQGLRLDHIESAAEPQPKPPPRRAVSLTDSVAFAALTLNEQRILKLLMGGDSPTYDQFEQAGVRRRSISRGICAMKALGLIEVCRAPYNVRTQRYERNTYRLADRWRALQPIRATAKDRKRAIAKAKDVASRARTSGEANVSEADLRSLREVPQTTH